MPRIRAANIEAHKAQTREEIFEAALALFSHKGYAGVSLGEVADLVGIGRTTMYDYFANKDELLLALIEDRVPPTLEDVVAQLRIGDGYIDRILELVDKGLDKAAEWPELTLCILRVGRKLPKTQQDRMWATLDPVANEVMGLVRDGIAKGRLAPMDPALAARFTMDLVIGGLDEMLRARDRGDLDVAYLEGIKKGLGDYLRRALEPR